MANIQCHLLSCIQIDCGASYAFASMGSLEGAYSLAFGSSHLLSEQNIIDCSRKVYKLQYKTLLGSSVYSTRLL